MRGASAPAVAEAVLHRAAGEIGLARSCAALGQGGKLQTVLPLEGIGQKLFCQGPLVGQLLPAGGRFYGVSGGVQHGFPSPLCFRFQQAMWLLVFHLVL